ncbi:MAG TPA: septal ring lytic transglycosylase RlpA family protein [Candidatus Peribacteraceae bacterium]|nr:septal ring lytic transglycosylase RlpA family protein [Candidatus Peribacteraceae bacterium]
MRRLILLLAVFAVPLSAVAATTAQSAPISREDGYQMIWDSLHRPAENVRDSFSDVPSSDPDEQIIDYGKARGILDDTDAFKPKDPLKLDDALVWLFRTRNVDDPDQITPQTLSGFLLKYPIALLPDASNAMPTVTRDQLMFLMRTLDADLVNEVHEVSLYSEQFNGQGTAFGETFDMYAMTAAHRTFPYNTLVKVTNVDNGKSVIVRINDRGPYVKGRDMDLSLGAFTTIAARSKGVIHATFQRLGDATLVGDCIEPAVYQQVITKNVILKPGIPHVFHLGDTLSIQSSRWFVVRHITYPDGTKVSIQNWVQPKTAYSFKPSIVGDYEFELSSADGHYRTMTMHVADCGAGASSVNDSGSASSATSSDSSASSAVSEADSSSEQTSSSSSMAPSSGSSSSQSE